MYEPFRNLFRPFFIDPFHEIREPDQVNDEADPDQTQGASVENSEVPTSEVVMMETEKASDGTNAEDVNRVQVRLFNVVRGINRLGVWRHAIHRLCHQLPHEDPIHDPADSEETEGEGVQQAHVAAPQVETMSTCGHGYKRCLKICRHPLSRACGAPWTCLCNSFAEQNNMRSEILMIIIRMSLTSYPGHNQGSGWSDFSFGTCLPVSRLFHCKFQLIALIPFLFYQDTSLWPSGIGSRLGRNRLWVRFLAVSDIYPMFIEPTIIWAPSGFSGYIWLDTKIVFKKKIWLFGKISHDHVHCIQV